MLTDLRGSLSRALRNAGIDKRVTLHTLRHCYTAARLQTTDNGAPVSVFTVMRELGHRSIDLIETTYGHLLDVRHRGPVVEYRETEVVQLPTAHRAEST
jgi:integrase